MNAAAFESAEYMPLPADSYEQAITECVSPSPSARLSKMVMCVEYLMST